MQDGHIGESNRGIIQVLSIDAWGRRFLNNQFTALVGRDTNLSFTPLKLKNQSQSINRGKKNAIFCLKDFQVERERRERNPGILRFFLLAGLVRFTPTPLHLYPISFIVKGGSILFPFVRFDLPIFYLIRCFSL